MVTVRSVEIDGINHSYNEGRVSGFDNAKVYFEPPVSCLPEGHRMQCEVDVSIEGKGVDEYWEGTARIGGIERIRTPDVDVESDAEVKIRHSDEIYRCYLPEEDHVPEGTLWCGRDI